MTKGVVATAKAHCIWLFFLCIILTVGCDASLTVGNRTIGVSSGGDGAEAR